MPGGILGGALKGIPRSPPSRRPRRRAKPSLRANSASTEHQLPPAPTTLARAGPGGEMVSRVQAKFVKQGVRESGPITRCADEDAAPVLGDSSPPQTAHRLLMVGKGGGGDSMTSIDRNSITSRILSLQTHRSLLYHLATFLDEEGTTLVALVPPALDPLDQCILERGMSALPRQRMARALYLHQHLLRHRRLREILIEIVIDGFPGLRPCLHGTTRHVWQNPVLEPLHDERGFAQLPCDGGVPAIAGERRRAVEAAVWLAAGRAPLAPHGLMLHGLCPDLLLSAFDVLAVARLRRRLRRGHPPEVV